MLLRAHRRRPLASRVAQLERPVLPAHRAKARNRYAHPRGLFFKEIQPDCFRVGEHRVESLGSHCPAVLIS